MRYLPKLIPAEHRVLPDYFKGSPYGPKQKKRISVRILSYVAAIILFIVALRFLAHPLSLVLFGFMGFVLLPAGHRLFERLLRFRLTGKIKSRLFIFLAVCSVPLMARDLAVEKQWAAARRHELAAGQQRQADQRKIDEERQALERQRLARQADSFSRHVKRARDFKSKRLYAEAGASLSAATSFVTGESDRQLVAQESAEIDILKIDDLIAHGKYKQAIPELDKRLQAGVATNDVLCKRAVCYSKTGRLTEAVADVKVAMQAGSQEAKRLHDRINPVRRRIVDHVTRCCDGTTSDATGRGACSHHGGVCDWNEPVYQEYRQYE